MKRRWKKGIFSQVPKFGEFKDPVTRWIMIKMSNVSDKTGSTAGEAVIKGSSTSPAYTYGHRKKVLILA
jgi:hypothetical protein